MHVYMYVYLYMYKGVMMTVMYVDAWKYIEYCMG